MILKVVNAITSGMNFICELSRYFILNGVQVNNPCYPFLNRSSENHAIYFDKYCHKHDLHLTCLFEMCSDLMSVDLLE